MTKLRHKCFDCDAMAIWHYQPSYDGPEEETYFCDAHVDRGCSCNIQYEETSAGNESEAQPKLDKEGNIVEYTDEQGRLLPCCEYIKDNDGFYMRYTLWIDDQAFDPDTPSRHAPYGWIVATSIDEAINIVKTNHLPELIDFDHNLGEIDGEAQEVTTFIKWMIQNYRDDFVPTYKIHSANPCAEKSITSLMESWKKISAAYDF
jgi:hypothetical protein